MDHKRIRLSTEDEQEREGRLAILLIEAAEASLTASGGRPASSSAAQSSSANLSPAGSFSFHDRCAAVLHSVAANMGPRLVAPSPAVAPPVSTNPWPAPRPSMASHFHPHGAAPELTAAGPAATGIVEVLEDDEAAGATGIVSGSWDGRWPDVPAPHPFPPPAPPSYEPIRAFCSLHGKLRSFRNLVASPDGLFSCSPDGQCMGNHRHSRRPSRQTSAPLLQVAAARFEGDGYPVSCPDGPRRICTRFLRQQNCHFDLPGASHPCRYSHSAGLRKMIWRIMEDYESDGADLD